MIHLAHRSLSLKKLHHGKNWSLVFVANHKEPLPFPHHPGRSKNYDTTVEGHRTLINCDLIFMTNGEKNTHKLRNIKTVFFCTHNQSVPHRKHIHCQLQIQ
jgi:hypothetical protein